ncbi:hypothetical protein [Saccharothrix coeruleofusca]|uniref:Uncharacterized protein n=1 Tax=Saccharothrix coeruleofusca TaxID=33919 RepID=A0A918AUH8_9PSEU|nr:hypothetical protein [Saccharothrix coeruleofusca]GGP86816.1 hypothetical protein GCM10010185_70700 [Saccharothrix coeruleofusca]
MIKADELDLRAALRRWPALLSLLELRGSGWRWMPPPLDDDGSPVELHGLRLWPASPIVDALRVRNDTDARAIRMDDEGGLLWQRDGDLVAVLDAVVGLPPPWHRHAPRLVIGSAPDVPARL